jgi:hypothetical protein
MTRIRASAISSTRAWRWLWRSAATTRAACRDTFRSRLPPQPSFRCTFHPQPHSSADRPANVYLCHPIPGVCRIGPEQPAATGTPLTLHDPETDSLQLNQSRPASSAPPSVHITRKTLRSQPDSTHEAHRSVLGQTPAAYPPRLAHERRGASPYPQ